MYDPLVDKDIGQGAAYPSSYWAAQTQTGASTGAIVADQSADIVVIGAGYTGLSCAYQLASRFNREIRSASDRLGLQWP
ncbi:FAD dependent oxidoreductase [Rheinheimera pacifica]|uniref:FAD dependent oxidoreductase n=1 Tax=Rheinheimera pacifica TaxID=173990 RepID=A0A1H6M636_9GAMM|nr:hypothetical protein [Rheinheimera pacifica]SEH96837.1 FAD dependent oxidoreductase [Rheinheimera pacifica]